MNTQLQQIISNTIEYAIEFAWQMGDDETMPRAERRHQILQEVITFIEENENIPDDDIDEFICSYLKREKK